MTDYTADTLYSTLRREGMVILGYDEGGVNLIAGARYRARKDGLLVTSSRGTRKHLSRSQAKRRPYFVSLTSPENPTTIVRPDGPDLDCDQCYPEYHEGCTGEPYNGAAPMSAGPGHHRCARHR